MKRTFFILVFLFTFKCYAQNVKSLLKQGGLIFLQTWIATPIDSTHYKLEKYTIIKEPFLFYEDTLYKEPKFGDLIGDSITIKHWNNRYYQEIKTKKGKTIREEFEVVDSCNEAINYLRNSIVFDPIYSSVNDTARKYIGYGNYQMAQTISYEKYTVCPFEFKKIAAAYEKDSYAKIQSIYAKKVNRHKWFIEHMDSVDLPVIIDFIKSFNNCKPDAEVLNLILLNKPLPFLKACDKIVPDYYMLSNLPKEIGWTDAIAQIEAQGFTPHKHNILKALKQNLPARNTK